MKQEIDINKLNEYAKSANNLKKIGLIELPDGGLSIRASRKGLSIGEELLECFELLDKYNETVGRK